MGFPHLKWPVPIVHLAIMDFTLNHMPLKKLSCVTVLNDTTPETKVVMKDSTAFMVTDMLKSVLQSPGTGTKLKYLDFLLQVKQEQQTIRMKK